MFIWNNCFFPCAWVDDFVGNIGNLQISSMKIPIPTYREHFRVLDFERHRECIDAQAGLTWLLMFPPWMICLWANLKWNNNISTHSWGPEMTFFNLIIWYHLLNSIHMDVLKFVERLSMKRLILRPVLADVPGATRLSCTVGSCASHRFPMRSTENPQPVVGCRGGWWGLVNTVSHQCSFWWVLWYVVVAFKHSLSTLWYPTNMVCRKVRYYLNACLVTFLLWLHWGPMGQL